MSAIDTWPSRWLALRRRWEKLSGKERNIWTAVVALGLLGLYGGLVWPLTQQRIDKLDYDLQKMSVRAKSAAKTEARPAEPPPGLSGKSPRDAEIELASLKEQLASVSAELKTLRGRFVPVDDSLSMNVLKSGLTGLAESGDMEVTAIEHVYVRPEHKERVPTPQMLKEAAEANPFKRPLIELHARASFRGLMQFLDGLHQLPFVAAPVESHIEVEADLDPKTRVTSRQWLNVRIRFAI